MRARTFHSWLLYHLEKEILLISLSHLICRMIIIVLVIGHLDFLLLTFYRMMGMEQAIT